MSFGYGCIPPGYPGAPLGKCLAPRPERCRVCQRSPRWPIPFWPTSTVADGGEEVGVSRPPPGSMVYWRAKGSLEWRFGYCTYAGGCDLLRMGRWNGDSEGGSVVSINDIEWRRYS